MHSWTTTLRHGVTRKRSTKRLKHTWNLFIICLLILDLKPFWSKVWRKAFYGQIIPESSCTVKETVDIDILVTYRNDYRKIMQFIRIISRPPSTIRKWNQLIQFRWTSTKLYLKLATFEQWAKGSREAATEVPAVLHICFCSLSNNCKLIVATNQMPNCI